MSKLLVATTLYPNAVQFRHGIFVEARLRRLLANSDHEAVVIAPVPWFPTTLGFLSRYADFTRIPRYEERQGIEVYHPRYLVIPKIGMLLTPFFLAWAMWRQFRLLTKTGKRFDLIDAHYYYPDGVAAAMLSLFVRLPIIITARGTDINVIAKMRLPGMLVRWAATKASCSIAVSAALKRTMEMLGFPVDRLEVLRNGVDLDRFRPLTDDDAMKPGPRKPVQLLSVGNLVELKGHDITIEALLELTDCELTIVGDGQLRTALERLAYNLGVQNRIRFVGTVDQEALIGLYNSADILVLASSREGMPNVVLESMACDTPVVATAAGGVPEIMTAPQAGVVVQARNAREIAAGVLALLTRFPKPGETRRYAERFSWNQTISKLDELIGNVTHAQH